MRVNYSFFKVFASDEILAALQQLYICDILNIYKRLDVTLLDF